MTWGFLKQGIFRERSRVGKQKFYHCVSRYFHYLPPVLAILLPVGSWPFLSEQQWRYSYFLFPVVSSLGWLFAIGLRERQLRAAAGQLLETKIRKLTERDEGLKNIRETIEKRQKEANRLKLHNDKLVERLGQAREVVIQAKGRYDHMEEKSRKLHEENKQLQMQLEAAVRERNEKILENQELRQELKETLAYQQELHDEYQATFVEQHNMLDKRQAYIGNLEAKVQDLMCELRNLLQLEVGAKTELPGRPMASRDVVAQLVLEFRKIVFRVETTEAADSLTALRYTRTDPSAHNYSLACRQLFDDLREENLGMLFIYAPFAQRVLFANALFKDWTGHGLEDFLNKEGDVVLEGFAQWERDLLTESRTERSGKIVIKTKAFGATPFYYCVVTLDKGPLAEHVLGVLYPAKASFFTNLSYI
ncbi:hypothetical protein C6H88_04680 [Chlamydia muridarum str. Nigg]|uniref:UPF0242 protein TC_0906 n=2 Tax=Chlamydia muridarum TaxID=83560 RepID=Y906_CHLMU|nr:hypothetical protein [Chlamydia muridarum]Q9PJC5.1 RecName: Full=UPF0242 protein TC_0906 [Chlamydia muridarum str. Nigg]UFT42447.1 hypothetical protein FTN53_04825 [Chlamydia trachomatis]AAF39699.1 conserved hypothetical protein [Chlamydia muridarum str. Nigg]AID38418.1 hypothetical protein BB17_04855 [Chlamydia muridarum str. Nigg 2 MCR]AJR10971.1 hypothetical protein BD36_04865 [Chlamydia muridarum]AVM88622.1 hypothetical protein C6H96_04675 [Chlamydia muridarum str. Nigg]